MSGGGWVCGSDDAGGGAVTWTDILNRPAGLDDGDDVGISSCTISQTYVKNTVSISKISGIGSAVVYCPAGYVRTGCSGGVGEETKVFLVIASEDTSLRGGTGTGNGCSVAADFTGTIGSDNAYVYAYCSKNTCSWIWAKLIS